jgi:hypothetical protein
MGARKILGWGKCTAKHTPTVGDAISYSDIKESTASLSVEEGQVQEALIEGGEAEGRKSQADKYIIEFDRRIGSEAEVTPGFTEDAGSIEIIPPSTGAIGVRLLNVSRKITLKGDSTDGLMAHYQYKTGGQTDDAGNVTDVVPFVKGAWTYSAVDSAGTGYSSKNPKAEGWYIKNGANYILSQDTTPQNGMTYYTRA